VDTPSILAVDPWITVAIQGSNGVSYRGCKRGTLGVDLSFNSLTTLDEVRPQQAAPGAMHCAAWLLQTSPALPVPYTPHIHTNRVGEADSVVGFARRRCGPCPA
jgi:hypothetical protein